MTSFQTVDAISCTMQCVTGISFQFEEGWYRIIDETGEDCLYPSDDFIIMTDLLDDHDV